MESLTQTEHDAAAWLARRDRGDWGAGEEAAFQHWLRAATAHRIAFLRVEAAWEETLRLKALAAGLPAGAGANAEWSVPVSFEEAIPAASETSAEQSSERSSWLRGRSIAIAAGVLLAIGMAGYFLVDRLQGDHYTTPVGGLASVPLQDGSKIMLSTSSTIRVEFTERERRIELTEGEAYFDVAKDPLRPFVVSAADKRVIAIGTRFSVRRSQNDLRVAVTQGQVRIETPKQRESPVLLSAGSIARTETDGVLIQKRAPADVEEILSWRTGYLTFNDTPLAEAVAEFNEYNTQKIVIEDAAVALIPLTGRFRSTNNEAFVRLLEEGYKLRSERVGEKILLSAQ